MSMSIGVMKSITFPVLLALSVILFLFVKKNGLGEKYGLCKPNIPASKMLFYIPILLLFTVNLWYGTVLNVTPLETVLYVLSMIFYKTKSMIVCIAMHSIFNSLSVFSNEAAMTAPFLFGWVLYI